MVCGGNGNDVSGYKLDVTIILDGAAPTSQLLIYLVAIPRPPITWGSAPTIDGQGHANYLKSNA